MFVTPGDRAGRHRPAMELIQQWVGTGVETNAEFPSIPDSYTHLRLIGQLRSAGGISDGFFVQVNGDTTAANYRTRFYYGSGGGDISTTTVAGLYPGNISGTDAPANKASAFEMTLENYRGLFYKDCTFVAKYVNSGNTFVYTAGGSEWLSLDPIHHLGVKTFGGVALSAGSTISLYGLR